MTVKSINGRLPPAGKLLELWFPGKGFKGKSGNWSGLNSAFQYTKLKVCISWWMQYSFVPHILKFSGCQHAMNIKV